MPFGKHANMFSGQAPLKDIFCEEVSGKHLKKPRVVADWDEKHLTEKELEAGAIEVNGRRGKMLVMGNDFKLPCLIEANLLKHPLPMRPGTSCGCWCETM
jgi:hypothetical protein